MKKKLQIDIGFFLPEPLQEKEESEESEEQSEDNDNDSENNAEGNKGKGKRNKTKKKKRKGGKEALLGNRVKEPDFRVEKIKRVETDEFE